MDAKMVWEVSKGGSDEVAKDKSDVSQAVEPGLACNEALQAALQLRKYVNELDDLFTCKLEVILGSFRQRTQVLGMQGMKDSKITNYFTPKEHFYFREYQICTFS